jgi:uncharacterized protein YdeI (YjbR/CyaY-like superfamily)
VAPVIVDPSKVREFADLSSFHEWLRTNHDREPEVWIKIHKKASGLPSITPVEAIDACLCWGWIDAIRKGFDERSFLQRYTPRGKKSIWSQVNIENVERLTREGRMTEHGVAQVDAAKADGRWDRAYGRSKDMPLPDDLIAALEGEPGAKAFAEKLNQQNRFAIAFRLHNMKTEAGRTKKIAAFVEMLKRGETIYPQKKS